MKNLTIALIIGFLNQSCSVYQKTPVILSQAYDSGKGKVVYKNGEELRFDNINFIDSVYTIDVHDRVRNEEGVFEWLDYKEEIGQADIQAIYLKGKTKGYRIQVQFIDERETIKGYLHSVTDSSILVVPSNNKFEVIGKATTIEVLVIDINEIKKSVRKAAIIGFIPGAVLGFLAGGAFGAYWETAPVALGIGIGLGLGVGLFTGAISAGFASKSYRIKGDAVKYRTKYMHKLEKKSIL